MFGEEAKCPLAGTATRQPAHGRCLEAPQVWQPGGKGYL